MSYLAPSRTKQIGCFLDIHDRYSFVASLRKKIITLCCLHVWHLLRHLMLYVSLPHVLCAIRYQSRSTLLVLSKCNSKRISNLNLKGAFVLRPSRRPETAKRAKEIANINKERDAARMQARHAVSRLFSRRPSRNQTSAQARTMKCNSVQHHMIQIYAIKQENNCTLYVICNNKNNCVQIKNKPLQYSKQHLHTMHMCNLQCKRVQIINNTLCIIEQYFVQ